MRYPSRRAFLTSLGTAAVAPVILGGRVLAQGPSTRVDAAARCDNGLRHSVASDDRREGPSQTVSVGSPIRMQMSPAVGTWSD
jgi:hypothetical protein